MSIPDWRAFSGGTTKRAALWLATEVGEGGVFTKEQLRAAFPGVSQVDRRARDLRDEGWVIHTNREDVSLLPGEQRLVAIGGRVWETAYHRQVGRGVSSKERQDTFARDDYSCTLCGISGGEAYPDEPLRKAKLMIGRLGPIEPNPSELMTICDRCHRGQATVTDAEALRAQLSALDVDQRDRLAGWVRTGRRTLSAEERAWAAYRRLPNDARQTIKEWLLGGDVKG